MSESKVLNSIKQRILNGSFNANEAMKMINRLELQEAKNPAFKKFVPTNFEASPPPKEWFELGAKLKKAKAQIKCPGCGVIYEVDYIHRFPVICLKPGCNAEYMQPIHDISSPEFIRQAAYRCRG